MSFAMYKKKIRIYSKEASSPEQQSDTQESIESIGSSRDVIDIAQDAGFDKNKKLGIKKHRRPPTEETHTEVVGSIVDIPNEDRSGEKIVEPLDGLDARRLAKTIVGVTQDMHESEKVKPRKAVAIQETEGNKDERRKVAVTQEMVEWLYYLFICVGGIVRNPRTYQHSPRFCYYAWESTSGYGGARIRKSCNYKKFLYKFQHDSEKEKPRKGVTQKPGKVAPTQEMHDSEKEKPRKGVMQKPRKVAPTQEMEVSEKGKPRKAAAQEQRKVAITQEMQYSEKEKPKSTPHRLIKVAPTQEMEVSEKEKPRKPATHKPPKVALTQEMDVTEKEKPKMAAATKPREISATQEIQEGASVKWLMIAATPQMSGHESAQSVNAAAIEPMHKEETAKFLELAPTPMMEQDESEKFLNLAPTPAMEECSKEDDNQNNKLQGPDKRIQNKNYVQNVKVAKPVFEKPIVKTSTPQAKSLPLHFPSKEKVPRIKLELPSKVRKILARPEKRQRVVKRGKIGSTDKAVRARAGDSSGHGKIHVARRQKAAGKAGSLEKIGQRNRGLGEKSEQKKSGSAEKSSQTRTGSAEKSLQGKAGSSADKLVTYKQQKVTKPGKGSLEKAVRAKDGSAKKSVLSGAGSVEKRVPTKGGSVWAKQPAQTTVNRYDRPASSMTGAQK